MVRDGHDLPRGRVLLLRGRRDLGDARRRSRRAGDRGPRARSACSTRRQVFNGVKVRVPKAYPMYDSGYREAVAEIRGYLEHFENLQTFGRNGLHRYNNQDHSMWTAMLATLEPHRRRQPRRLVGEHQGGVPRGGPARGGPRRPRPRRLSLRRLVQQRGAYGAAGPAHARPARRPRALGHPDPLRPRQDPRREVAARPVRRARRLPAAGRRSCSTVATRRPGSASPARSCPFQLVITSVINALQAVSTARARSSST